MKLIDLQRAEFNQKYIEYMESQYPFEFKFGDSRMLLLFDLYRAGENFIPRLVDLLNCVRPKKNYPFFWYDNGVDIGKSFEYSKTYKKNKIDLCAWCNDPFSKSEGHKSCCCIEHYQQNRLRGNERLSVSKKMYNSRDPAQYANRHSIPIEEATAQVNKFVRESSVLTQDYWLKLGYNTEEATKKISEVQRKNSPRCVDSWLKRGYNKEEATEEVRKHQSVESCKRFAKYTPEEVREQSSFSYLFWMKRGYNEETSKSIVSSISKSGNVALKEKYTEEERRKFNVRCTEYWIERHAEAWKEHYIKFMNSLANTSFRSKIADEFCSELSKSFLGDKLYFGETEFAMCINNKGIIRIDFTNTTKNFCVEFHGDYWHANPLIYEENEMISFPKNIKKRAGDVWILDQTRMEHIRRRGFRVFVVWESEYKLNRQECIANLIGKVTNEN